jgi:hypothetical protein
MSKTPWEDVTTPGSPIRRRMRLNTANKHTIEFHSQQEYGDILKHNVDKRLADRSSSSLWNGQEWVHVAEIPLLELERWAKEENIDFFRWNEEDKAKIIKRLNDSGYSKLRTAEGRI